MNRVAAAALLLSIAGAAEAGSWLPCMELPISVAPACEATCVPLQGDGYLGVGESELVSELSPWLLLTPLLLLDGNDGSGESGGGPPPWAPGTPPWAPGPPPWAPGPPPWAPGPPPWAPGPPPWTNDPPPAVDPPDVSLETVPEPATLVMFALILAGGGLTVSRRSRKSKRKHD